MQEVRNIDMLAKCIRPLLVVMVLAISQLAPGASAKEGVHGAVARHDAARQGPPAIPPRRRGGPFTGVACGTVLDEPGYYKLDQHLVCSDVGIEITSDDVHLDFAGYSLTCDQTGFAFGVFVRDVAGVTVKNGTVTQCTVGIFLLGTERSFVRNMELTGNNFDNPDDASGLLLNGANDNAILGSAMIGNGHGISLFDSSGNRLIGNDSSDNRYDGLRLLPLSPSGGSNDNHIVNNRFNRNDPNVDWFSSGVQWSGPSTGNVFLRNETNDNGFLGVLVYGVTSEGFPLPTGNLIKSNTALGNVILDLGEVDFSIFPDLTETCENEWLNNTFGTEFGPIMCVR
jgi:parallel beta-helix repeat protein